MGGWRTASVKMQYEPVAEAKCCIFTLASFYLKSSRNIVEACQIRTNQNWYRILRTCNKQSDIKGEKCLIIRILELKILWLRMSLLRNL